VRFLGGACSYLDDVYSVEIDEVSVATYIVDGDTFDVAMGERVRLADVDTPERGQVGYSEASYFLGQLIYGERVYLDVMMCIAMVLMAGLFVARVRS